MKYYLAIDETVQWFRAAFRFEEDTLIERVDVDTHISGEFLNEIFAREQHFTNKRIADNIWGGWSISEKEFYRIKRIVQLQSLVDEYNRLLEYR